MCTDYNNEFRIRILVKFMKSNFDFYLKCLSDRSAILSAYYKGKINGNFEKSRVFLYNIQYYQ